MKHYTTLLFYICFFLPIAIDAHIIEHDDINIIKDIVDEKKDAHTIIIFDIDNTIGRLPSIGNDEWFYGLAQYIKQTYGIRQEEAFDAVLSTYCAIQMNNHLRLIQPETPQLLKQLDLPHIYMYALTARSFEIIPRTVKQIKNMKITFKPHVYAPKKLYLSIKKPAYYYKGILFAGRNNKGELLLLFLKTLGITPDRIIFIDDKMHNILDVERALQKTNIEFVGVRYSRCDQIVNAFDVTSTFNDLKQFYHMHPEVTPMIGFDA